MASSQARPTSSEPSAGAQPGRILAIDYGRRRIGLALSDELGLTAQPLATLDRTSRRNDLRRFREIVRKHAVRRIVVGHPLRLDGTVGEMAAQAAQFAARLGKELTLPVELVDERLTSWEAEQMLREAPGSWRRRPATGRSPHGAVDPIAAAVILRDYLARRKQEKT